MEINFYVSNDNDFCWLVTAPNESQSALEGDSIIYTDYKKFE